MTSFRSPVLKKVMDANLCAGCGLCAGVSGGAVQMQLDGQGYLRPHQTGPLSLGSERKLEAACPGVTVSRSMTGSNHHPIWGPFEEVHTGWATNEDLRYHGSSGAVLSAVAHHLVKTGQVDFILTIRDSDEDPISNKTHVAETFKDIYRSAGSRYAPSAPLSEIDAYLSGDKRFAVVAKPCDIAALRALARVDKRVDSKVPFLMSFFCAGVPSRRGSLAVLKKLNVAEEDLNKFQYRGDGWPGYAKATRHDGTVESMSYHDSWGKVLSSFVQFRCKVCPDGTGGAADLVCADAWHSDKDGYPLFEDGEGTSLVMARTKRGQALLHEAVAAGEVALASFDIDTLLTIQPGQTRRSQALLARLLGLFFKTGWRPAYKGFSILKNARSLGARDFISNLIGTFRRA